MLLSIGNSIYYWKSQFFDGVICFDICSRHEESSAAVRQYIAETDWHELAGKRVKVSQTSEIINLSCVHWNQSTLCPRLDATRDHVKCSANQRCHKNCRSFPHLYSHTIILSVSDSRHAIPAHPKPTERSIHPFLALVGTELMECSVGLSAVEGIVVEAIEIPNKFYFTAERGVRDPSHAPPLCDLVWERTSPAIVAMQFLSAILHCCIPMVQVFWISSGLESFEHWYANCPDDVDHAREVLVAGHLSVDIRHWLRFGVWPWPFAAYGDHRRSDESLSEIDKRYDDSCKFCFDEGHGRRLKEAGLTSDDMKSQRFKVLHEEWSKSFDTNNDSSERSFAQVQSSFSQYTGLGVFCAKAMIQDAQRGAKLACGLNGLKAKPVKKCANAIKDKVETPPGHVNFKAWFHSYCSRRDSISSSVHCTAKSYWKKVFQELDSMPAERRAIFEEMHRADRKKFLAIRAAQKQLMERPNALPAEAASRDVPVGSGVLDRFMSSTASDPQYTKHAEIVPLKLSTWKSFMSMMARHNSRSVTSVAKVWASKLDGFCRDNGVVDECTRVHVQCGAVCRATAARRRCMLRMKPLIDKEVRYWKNTWGDLCLKKLKVLVCFERVSPDARQYWYFFCVDKFGAGVDGFVVATTMFLHVEPEDAHFPISQVSDFEVDKFNRSTI